MKEEHLAGFRRGLTTTLKKYADASGLLDRIALIFLETTLEKVLQQLFL
jgi:hypothetical protein